MSAKEDANVQRQDLRWRPQLQQQLSPKHMCIYDISKYKYKVFYISRSESRYRFTTKVSFEKLIILFEI